MRAWSAILGASLAVACQASEREEASAPRPQPVADAFVRALLSGADPARADALLGDESPQRGGLIIPPGTVEEFKEWAVGWKMTRRGAPEREGDRFVYRLQGSSFHTFRCGFLEVRMRSEARSWTVHEFAYVGRTGSEGDFGRAPGATVDAVCEPVFAGERGGSFESWP